MGDGLVHIHFVQDRVGILETSQYKYFSIESEPTLLTLAV